MAPNPADAKNATENMTQLSEVLGNLSIDGSGATADAVRQDLAKSGKHAQILTDASRAVHTAAERYAKNKAQFDATAPTEAEIAAAQQGVLDATERAAAGVGSEADVQTAVDKLGKLLADRETAQGIKDASDGETHDEFEGNTGDLTDPEKNPGLADMLKQAMMSPQQQPPMMPQQPPMMPQQPMGGAPGGSDPGQMGGVPSPTPDFSSARDFTSPFDSASDSPAYQDSLPGYGSGDGEGDGGYDFNLENATDGTELTGADTTPFQPPTLSGVNTPADVSGRPNAPFAVAPSAVTGTGSPGMGASGMPIAPMMPMGGMGAGGAGGAGSKDTPKILTSDPYFTGKDIDDEQATDGVLRDSGK